MYDDLGTERRDLRRGVPGYRRQHRSDSAHESGLPGGRNEASRGRSAAEPIAAAQRMWRSAAERRQKSLATQKAAARISEALIIYAPSSLSRLIAPSAPIPLLRFWNFPFRATPPRPFQRSLRRMYRPGASVRIAGQCGGESQECIHSGDRAPRGEAGLSPREHGAALERWNRRAPPRARP